ncbi:hypothetical protein OG216_14820 [Streptomycetaceae bacterium NBC_01309]
MRRIGTSELPDPVAAMLSTALPATLRCPLASVPAGFDAQGMAYRIQTVGRPGRDIDVLRLAKAVESVCEAVTRRTPAIG